MKSPTMKFCLLGLLLAGLLSAAAKSADLSGCWSWNSWLSPGCSCCPDDYCRKPLPCPDCPPAQCCPDTYCRKPLPGVPCLQRGCDPSCYKIKPLPPVPCCHEPWYKCVPACKPKLP